MLPNIPCSTFAMTWFVVVFLRIDSPYGDIVESLIHHSAVGTMTCFLKVAHRPFPTTDIASSSASATFNDCRNVIIGCLHNYSIVTSFLLYEYIGLLA